MGRRATQELTLEATALFYGSSGSSCALHMLTLVICIGLVAFPFDFVNGFHDAANSIATVVATRVLSPLQAVVWAAFFNFVAAFGFGSAMGHSGHDRVGWVLTIPASGLIAAMSWSVLRLIAM